MSKSLSAIYSPLREYLGEGCDDTLRKWSQSQFLPKLWQRPSTLSALIKPKKSKQPQQQTKAEESKPRKRKRAQIDKEDGESEPEEAAEVEEAELSEHVSGQSSMADDEQSGDDDDDRISDNGLISTVPR